MSRIEEVQKLVKELEHMIKERDTNENYSLNETLNVLSDIWCHFMVMNGEYEELKHLKELITNDCSEYEKKIRRLKNCIQSLID